MRKVLVFIISLLIGLAVFGLVTSDVGVDGVIEAFSGFPDWGIIVMLLLSALISAIGTWRLKFILKTQGYNIPFLKVMEVWFSGFAISYLTPIAILGGEVFMVYTLRKVYPVSWEKSSAAVFIHKVLDATAFFPFLIAGVIVFPFLSGYVPSTGVVLSGGVVAVIIITLLAFFYIKSFRSESPLDLFLKLFGINKKKLGEKKGGQLILAAEKEIVGFFNPRKKIMWQGMGMALLRYCVILLRCVILLFLFTGSWNVLQAVASYGFFNLAVLVPVPAMLGSLEVAQRLVFDGMGLGSNVGIAFSFVLRAMDVLLCLVGLVILIKFGAKLIRIKVMEIIDRLLYGGINNNITS